MSLSLANFASNQISDAENSTSPRSCPLTATDASSILSQLASATRNTNLSGCRKSVATIRVSAADKQKNCRRLAASGAAGVLASAFRHFASAGTASLDLLSEILSALVLVYPIHDQEFSREIGSPDSLHAIISILRSGKSSGKLNAVLVLKQIVSSDADLARAAARIDGLIEALMRQISYPISPRGEKAARLAVCHLAVSCEEWVVERLLEMGFVSMVIESIVEFESEKKVIEAGLSAVDRLCACELGREKVYGNALAVPVLAKNILGFSELATDLAVSSLWKLCENWEGGDGGFVVEVLEVGVFVKLLILLQVECREGVKERATKLLKFLKGCRGNGGLGCVDSFDFRGLKRPV